MRTDSALASVKKRRVQASVFAALGDETRLALLAKLCDGAPRSIAQLTEGTDVTRQAVRKHLNVLEEVGVVHGTREGRETRFFLEPAPLDEARSYLELVSAQWDHALARLKALVEKEDDGGSS